MKGITTRRGIALGLAVAALTVMFIVFFGILRLMRGVGTQIEYADSHIRALTIAESGVNYLTARLLTAPWEDRWFATQPDFRSRPISYGGGSFIYAIQDTPNRPRSADIWVRADFRGRRRLIFYRLAYEDLLFKGLIRPNPEFTVSVDEGKAAAGLNGSVVDQLGREVDRLIATRHNTRTAYVDAWDSLAVEVDPLAILRRLQADIPEEEILRASRTPTGEPAIMIAPPKFSPPTGSQSNIPNVDRNKIQNWISAQNFDDDFASMLRSRAGSMFSSVDRQVAAQQFLEAESTLKNFLVYLYTISGRINTSILQAREDFRRRQRELEEAAVTGDWPPEALEQKKAELEREYRARLDQIYADSRPPEIEP
jgi:hypothetical protein